MSVFPDSMQSVVHWLGQNPLATATILYFTALMSVLIYTYFETRKQH